MTTSVDRHEPRNNKIIIAVRAAAMAPSRTTLATADVDEYRLIEQFIDVEAGGRRCARGLQHLPTSFTTSSVDALPFLMTLSRTAR